MPRQLSDAKASLNFKQTEIKRRRLSVFTSPLFYLACCLMTVSLVASSPANADQERLKVTVPSGWTGIPELEEFVFVLKGSKSQQSVTVSQYPIERKFSTFDFIAGHRIMLERERGKFFAVFGFDSYKITDVKTGVDENGRRFELILSRYVTVDGHDTFMYERNYAVGDKIYRLSYTEDASVFKDPKRAEKFLSAFQPVVPKGPEREPAAESELVSGARTEAPTTDTSAGKGVFDQYVQKFGTRKPDPKFCEDVPESIRYDVDTSKGVATTGEGLVNCNVKFGKGLMDLIGGTARYVGSTFSTIYNGLVGNDTSDSYFIKINNMVSAPMVNFATAMAKDPSTALNNVSEALGEMLPKFRCMSAQKRVEIMCSTVLDMIMLKGVAVKGGELFGKLISKAKLSAQESVGLKNLVQNAMNRDIVKATAERAAKARVKAGELLANGVQKAESGVLKPIADRINTGSPARSAKSAAATEAVAGTNAPTGPANASELGAKPAGPGIQATGRLGGTYEPPQPAAIAKTDLPTKLKINPKPTAVNAGEVTRPRAVIEAELESTRAAHEAARLAVNSELRAQLKTVANLDGATFTSSMNKLDLYQSSNSAIGDQIKKGLLEILNLPKKGELKQVRQWLKDYSVSSAADAETVLLDNLYKAKVFGREATAAAAATTEGEVVAARAARANARRAPAEPGEPPAASGPTSGATSGAAPPASTSAGEVTASAPLRERMATRLNTGLSTAKTSAKDLAAKVKAKLTRSPKPEGVAPVTPPEPAVGAPAPSSSVRISSQPQIQLKASFKDFTPNQALNELNSAFSRISLQKPWGKFIKDQPPRIQKLIIDLANKDSNRLYNLVKNHAAAKGARKPALFEKNLKAEIAAAESDAAKLAKAGAAADAGGAAKTAADAAAAAPQGRVAKIMDKGASALKTTAKWTGVTATGKALQTGPGKVAGIAANHMSEDEEAPIGPNFGPESPIGLDGVPIEGIDSGATVGPTGTVDPAQIIAPPVDGTRATTAPGDGSRFIAPPVGGASGVNTLGDPIAAPIDIQSESQLRAGDPTVSIGAAEGAKAGGDTTGLGTAASVVGASLGQAAGGAAAEAGAGGGARRQPETQVVPPSAPPSPPLFSDSGSEGSSNQPTLGAPTGAPLGQSGPSHSASNSRSGRAARTPPTEPDDIDAEDTRESAEERSRDQSEDKPKKSSKSKGKSSSRRARASEAKVFDTASKRIKTRKGLEAQINRLAAIPGGSHKDLAKTYRRLVNQKGGHQIAERLAKRARNGNFREVVREIEQHKHTTSHEVKRHPAKAKHKKAKPKKKKNSRHRAQPDTSDPGEDSGSDEPTYEEED